METYKKMITFDVETTGLKDADEILQVSIVDMDYNVLWNRYYKPRLRQRWDASQKIHGISPEQVKDCPNVEEDIPQIQKIFDECDAICGYHTSFDIDKLRENGVVISEDIPVVDVMEDFAPIYGDWSDMYRQYRYKTLGECARYYGYTFTAHDSLEDSKATLYCYYKVKEYYDNHLTERQQDAMSEISYMLYSAREGERSLFSPFDPDHDRIVSYVYTSLENPIKQLISEHRLPAWTWEQDLSVWPVDDERFEHSEFAFEGVTYPADPDYDDPVYDLKRDAGRRASAQLMDSWRASLQRYIDDVNSRYSTQF